MMAILNYPCNIDINKAHQQKEYVASTLVITVNNLDEHCKKEDVSSEKSDLLQE